jgi:lipopolysaccharide assembly protein A
MIRYLRYFLFAVLALVLISLALANRAPVEVNLLTQDLSALFGVNWTLQLPMFLVIFASIILGLLIGFVWEWLREYKHRKVAGDKTRQVTKLERELAAMQDARSLPKDDILAILDKSKK